MEILLLLPSTPNLNLLLVLPHGISQSSYFPYGSFRALLSPMSATEYWILLSSIVILGNYASQSQDYYLMLSQSPWSSFSTVLALFSSHSVLFIFTLAYPEKQIQAGVQVLSVCGSCY